MIGALVAVRTLKSGGRYSMIAAGYIAMAGIALTMIENYWILMFGRLLMGIGNGVSNCAKFRFIEEYVPQKFVAQCIAIDWTFA